MTKPANVDAYIASFPADVQVLLEQVRSTIRTAAPQAEEVISYGMPAYKWNGILVYFAGYRHHIGFYPTATGVAAFKEALSGYKGARGSVQFPLNQPIPLELIARIVEFKVTENAQKPEAKKKASLPAEKQGGQ